MRDAHRTINLSLSLRGGTRATSRTDPGEGSDVGRWGDELDLQLTVVGFSGQPCDVYLITSMQKDVEDDTWDTANAPATQFSTVSATGVKNAHLASGGNKPLLRYLRWKVVSTAAQSITITFTLTGIARRKGA
jgi:hypothetical protein